MIADRRLCLTERGEVVEDGDGRGVELLVGAGGELEDERARALGIGQDGDGRLVYGSAGKQLERAEDKQIAGPAETKAEGRRTVAVQVGGRPRRGGKFVKAGAE